ncbi:hypothetical protein A2881_05355 [Candidatus Peribacteria bacterium RIFCSPHIGHO2_01_FULL_55_13]|nr:MAG: hypothetical protein A2881_05355 [Candidatus Peribacteria bacterium RIFCSPHIGHO2_01_FULL_55_13]OGJ66561.1 MAG: hypothetical protein A3F36_02935 [Candidatus Peribacteria bacterium RIFCSPHIGHO2_12_FULL_55_11]
MKFSYVKQYGCSMPIIPVKLRRGELIVATEALVDSGAGSCIFDAQFADVLGIHDITEGGIQVVFEGVSGHTIVGYRHDVALEIGGRVFSNISIAFSEQMPDNATNILGQLGFFEICPIKFTYQKREVDIMTGSIR